MASQTTTITTDTFEADVVGADRPVLVDFWAPWCAPCRVQGPILDDVAEEVGERFVIGKVNVDENPDIAGALSITSIPTLMIFSRGRPVERFTGVRSADVLVAALERAATV